MIDKTFLENSVYYPACAFDGTPIKFLGKMFSNFVYADYLSEYDKLEKNISTCGLKGYKLNNSSLINAEELFGISWEEFIKRYNDSRFGGCDKNLFAKIYSFERCADFNDEHGRKNIELLYLKAEGISALKYLYARRNITPKCFVSINPGLNFGCNYYDYPEKLINLIKSTGKLPQYQFYDDDCADIFNEIIKNYYAINQYDCDREYFWSTHFTLAKLKIV